MTIFKTFLRILNKNKIIVIIYTVMLLIFGATNMKNNQTTTDFTATKPDILIINNDEDKGISKDLIKYMTENSNVKDIADNDEAISDALFYRDVNYIIIIPKDFNKDFMSGKNPEIEIKSTDDYVSSLAEMMLERYLNVALSYQNITTDENELINMTNETLSKQADVTITSKLDTTSLTKASTYYNFASYSLLACLLYVICLILSTFNEEMVKKRTIISSTNYKKHNRQLLLSNCVYSLVLWLLYVIASIVLIGNVMFSTQGLIMIINSFIFMLCTTSIAFFIGTFVTNKNAINGIVNVVALGSSFLCGAFVPQEWLPSFVLNIAHILPTYYYINTNDKLTTLEIINTNTLKPIITNIIIIIAFTIIFIVLANIISKRKRKIS